MQVIQILNQNNEVLNVQAIRYFKSDDKSYFVFSLNEIDEQGYIKVYVSKVIGLNGTFAGYDIIDETEWARVKEVVKSIIKANREGSSVPVRDLDVNELGGIKVNGQQVFKLLTDLVNLLGANVQVVEDEVVTPVMDPVVEQVIEPVVPVLEQAQQDNQISDNVLGTEGVEDSASSSLVDESGSSLEQDEQDVSVVPSGDIEESVDSYKELYLEQLSKNEQLLEEITRYKTQLESIKAILG